MAFGAGAVVGVLGGLVGLGGAEFRLPLLIAVFGFAALSAVIVNKAMSLVVVAAAIPARLFAVPLAEVAGQWVIVVNLLIGSLAGAWVGASWAARMRTAILYRVLAILLVALAGVFAASHWGVLPQLDLDGVGLFILGVVAGFVIGVVAAVMGVAGGELLIPTITVLYALDIKLAGSLSLLVSLPTMLVAFLRYSRTQAFSILREVPTFVVAMTLGSIAGTSVGGLIAGVVSTAVIGPLVVLLLLASAWKVWQHSTE
ncbi:MAG: uncharacterized protein QG671_2511 [Actinomycetota bacterium]|nr:uncharacterized protein [Actinomycetota bacterium]